MALIVEVNRLAPVILMSLRSARIALHRTPLVLQATRFATHSREFFPYQRVAGLRGTISIYIRAPRDPDPVSRVIAR